ncbi:rCG63267 [Rattus norvegicus]|uniref:RCG63267 n=1 Tax=Rattus norvegicus TaxID=10116 RepID=A6JGK4_RAT|nr:rCG63267 [Rattus norvegicus]
MGVGFHLSELFQVHKERKSPERAQPFKTFSFTCFQPAFEKA